jgi:hypothetical protein
VTNAARAQEAAGIGHNSERQTCPHCKQPWLHRSDADHRMLHAIVSIAYANWPEDYEDFQPLGRDHLYGYLLIAAGWHEPPVEIESRNPDFIREIVMALFPMMKRKIHCIRFAPTAKGVRVLIPKSLDYKTAGKRQFEDVRSKVYEVLESVLGVPIETLKHEAKAA